MRNRLGRLSAALVALGFFGSATCSEVKPTTSSSPSPEAIAASPNVTPTPTPTPFSDCDAQCRGQALHRLREANRLALKWTSSVLLEKRGKLARVLVRLNEVGNAALEQTFVHGATPRGDEVHWLVGYVDAITAHSAPEAGAGAVNLFLDKTKRHFEAILDNWPDSCYADIASGWLDDPSLDELPALFELPEVC